MRLFAACACAAISFAGSAGADIIAQNLPVTPVVDQQTGRLLQNGTFSDALASKGGYFWSQAIAQRFTVDAGSTASIASLRWWGASEYIASQEPWNETALSSNIAGFQISILSTDNTPSNQFSEIGRAHV